MGNSKRFSCIMECIGRTDMLLSFEKEVLDHERSVLRLDTMLPVPEPLKGVTSGFMPVSAEFAERHPDYCISKDDCDGQYFATLWRDTPGSIDCVVLTHEERERLDDEFEAVTEARWSRMKYGSNTPELKVDNYALSGKEDGEGTFVMTFESDHHLKPWMIDVVTLHKVDQVVLTFHANDGGLYGRHVALRAADVVCFGHDLRGATDVSKRKERFDFLTAAGFDPEDLT